MGIDIGRVGVWVTSHVWRAAEAAERRDAVAELEDLGYGAIWLGGADYAMEVPAALLAASRRIAVATGIVNVWAVPADELAAWYAAIAAEHADRFLLGVGISHAPIVPQYARPMEKLTAYLDELDAASPPVPPDRRVVAALGPRALELAAARSLGSHPYFTTPEHTREARRLMGPGALLAPEQMVLLETDPERAREVARPVVARYLALPNYVASLRRQGFTDEDVAGSGSERLIDAIIAWGDPAAIAARVAEHHAAGADHVCLQVLGTTGLPRAAWRTLAETLSTSRPAGEPERPAPRPSDASVGSDRCSSRCGDTAMGRRVGRSGRLAALALVAGTVLAAGCGANGGSAASDVAAPGAARAAAGGNAAAGGSSSGSNAGPKPSAAVTDGRSLIVTAALQVTVADAAAAAARAADAATAVGGYVGSESVGGGPQPVPAPASVDGTTPPPAAFPATSDAPDLTQAVLVLRVPPAALGALLAKLPQDGRITYQNQASTDVTGQVADVNSRVASAQAGITELRALIARASAMSDLISLEDALAQRESDLESLEAQQKALADQTLLATVTVEYVSQGTHTAAAAGHGGFVRGLLTGWHGLVDVVRALLIALGWLLPVGGIAAAVAAAIWYPVRRIRRRRRAAG